VTTRLTCLLFGVAILIAGLVEPSVGLMAAAAGIVALSLLGIVKGCENAVERRVRWPSQNLPVLPSFSRTLILLAAGFSLLTIALTREGTYSLIAILFWLAAIGCLALLGPSIEGLTLADARAVVRQAAERRHRPEIGTVLAITVVAFVLRYYDVGMVPPTFHGDEGEMGLLAIGILEGAHVPVFATSPFWGLPYLFNYLQALDLMLFGRTVFGIRLLSVIVGTLCIPVVYSIGRIGWGTAAGAAAAWLIAVSHLHIHYSRMATIFVESTLLTSVMVLLLAMAHETGAPAASGEAAAEPEKARPGIWTLLILAGIAGGLSQCFSIASWAVPIIAALILVLLWRARRATVWQIAAFAFAFVVVYAPLASHYADNPAGLFARLVDVGIFNGDYVKATVGPSATLPSALPHLLAEQVRLALAMYVRSGDAGGFYSASFPAFDVVTAGLIWLGLGAALARFRRFHEAAGLIWLGLGTLFATVMTVGASSGQRLLIVTPVLFLLGGIFVARILRLLQQTSTRPAEWLVVPIGTTAALWLLAANVATYFYEYVPRAESAEATGMAREMLVEPGRYRVYFLTQPRYDSHYGAIRYIAYGVEATNLNTMADFQMPPDDGKGVLLLALDHRLDDLRTLEARIPGGTETRVNAPLGHLLYLVYRVPPRG
jgi:4-amino-4-deoxy-L-arabinose transferase-like glycosyltransferase